MKIYKFLVFLVLLISSTLSLSCARNSSGNQKENKKTFDPDSYLKEVENRKKSEEWKIFWEEARKKQNKEYFAVLYIFKTNLAKLGYLSGPIKCEEDEQLKLAIQDYQKTRGLTVIGEPNSETMERILQDIKIVVGKNINLPIFYFGDSSWDVYFNAAGTWVIENETQAHPMQTSDIFCDKQKKTCRVATAKLQDSLMNALDDYLGVESETYEIERWDEYEITTKPLDYACVRYMLRVNRASKTVTGLRSPKETKGDLCKGLDKKEMILTLKSGVEVEMPMVRSKLDEAAKIMRIDATCMSNLKND